MNAEPRFLMVMADGDVDEDEGLTREEILEMLAEELGYKLVKPT